MTFAQPGTDSPSGQQWHVRYRMKDHGPDGRAYWSYIADTERDAYEHLAMYRRDNGVTDIELFVRDVSPWRKVDGA